MTVTRTRRDGSRITLPRGWKRRPRPVVVHHYDPIPWSFVLPVVYGVVLILVGLYVLIHPLDPNAPSYWDSHSLPGQHQIVHPTR